MIKERPVKKEPGTARDTRVSRVVVSLKKGRGAVRREKGNRVRGKSIERIVSDLISGAAKRAKGLEGEKGPTLGAERRVGGRRTTDGERNEFGAASPVPQPFLDPPPTFLPCCCCFFCSWSSSHFLL